MFFGGLTLSDVNTVESVKAVGVAYFLDSADNWKEEVGNKWEKRVLDDVLELKDVYAPDLEVRYLRQRHVYCKWIMEANWVTCAFWALYVTDFLSRY
jgi:hypothetical protein